MCPKNAKQRIAQTSAGVDASRREEGRKTESQMEEEPRVKWQEEG